MHALPSRDEMADQSGRLRRHWAPIIEAAKNIGTEELSRRGASFNRQMNLAAPFGVQSQRQYDVLPAVLSAEDFRGLEVGLRQRAQMLNMALNDLYGPQLLLHDKDIPPALIVGNSKFQRGMVTQNLLATPRLAIYAADVIREPDGSFAVLRDHTGIIPGFGHALSLRRTAAATLPEIFQGAGLQSLRPAREMLIDHLQRGANGGLVAVLTAGAEYTSEPADMLDDALLARALGLLLVEPGDLAERSGALHVKTLSGLLPARTLLRGISGAELDPLEQGGRPSTGIAGSFGAIRCGALAMLNAPGTALIQSPELVPYLPAMFMKFLGRDALLRSAQDVAFASRAPFVVAGEIVSTPIMFRLFCWHNGQDWQLVTGGLGIALPGPASGGARFGLKDLWVLDEMEPHIHAGAAPAEPLERPKLLAAVTLPSRIADNLFWLGRSVERVDAAARLLMLAMPRLESSTSLPRDIAERALIAKCLAKVRLLPMELSGGGVSGRFLRAILAKRKPLAGLVKEAARLLNASSERLSPSMLATVRYALNVASEALPDEAAAVPALLSFTASFAGVAAENMSRDGGWLFLEMGRRLERAETIAETLAILLDASPEHLEPGLGLGIELADSVLTYDLRHAGILTPTPVIAMLLAEAGNPRSLVFQCSALNAALARLGADDDASIAKSIQEEALALADQTTGLAAPLAGIAAKLRQLSDNVHRRFFTLLPEAHQLDDENELEAAQ